MGNFAHVQQIKKVVSVLCVFLSLTVGVVVALVTAPPPQDIQDLVEDIRVPGTRTPHGIADAEMLPD